MTVELRCPFCNAQGMAQMGAKDAGLFLIVHCKTCGAVHGVVPKPPAPQLPTKPMPAEEPTPEVEPAPAVGPAPDPDESAEGEEEFYLSPEKARLLNMFHSPQVSTGRRKVIYTPGKVG